MSNQEQHFFLTFRKMKSHFCAFENVDFSKIPVTATKRKEGTVQFRDIWEFRQNCDRSINKNYSFIVPGPLETSQRYLNPRVYLPSGAGSRRHFTSAAHGSMLNFLLVSYGFPMDFLLVLHRDS